MPKIMGASGSEFKSVNGIELELYSDDFRVTYRCNYLTLHGFLPGRTPPVSTLMVKMLVITLSYELFVSLRC